MRGRVWAAGIIPCLASMPPETLLVRGDLMLAKAMGTGAAERLSAEEELSFGNLFWLGRGGLVGLGWGRGGKEILLLFLSSYSNGSAKGMLYFTLIFARDH